MKKIAVLATILALLVLPLSVRPVLAAPGDPPHLNWGSEVNAGECPPGKLVINVTHKVVNDIDSGIGGYWATDTYNRHIQVWEVGSGTFCAVVRYVGAFVTDDGPSPQGTDGDGIAAGITGTFEGGYRSTIFTGTLDPGPAYRTQGNISAFDYGCDVETGSCTSLFNWPATYFTATSGFDLDWWGWVYHGGDNGTWVNSSDGNEGDITDAFAAPPSEGCTTIQDGGLVDSLGNPLVLGYDQFGYNYQAHEFNGTYDSSDRNLDGTYWGNTGDYVDDHLWMKWSDDWLSNQDCTGDGKLDRDGFTGISKGWLTNHVEGDYTDGDGNLQHYTDFVKIVWVGPGGSLWGQYDVIQEVYNDPAAGFHGLQFKAGAPGLGLNDHWTP